MMKVRPAVTDVCVSDGYSREPYKNGWTDRVCDVRDMDLDGPKELGIWWGPGPSHGNNNNNSHDNVYGAVIMTKVIARFHPVHLMNADWAPGGRQPSDQASRLGLWIRRKLAAIIHIHHRHCYYYSARRRILILPSHEGWKAEST